MKTPEDSDHGEIALCEKHETPLYCPRCAGEKGGARTHKVKMDYKKLSEAGHRAQRHGRFRQA